MKADKVYTRSGFPFLLTLFVHCLFVAELNAQSGRVYPSEPQNASFEDTDEDRETHWFGVPPNGATVAVDKKEAFHGSRSLLFDSTKAEKPAVGKSIFNNSRQVIDARSWAGKRVRYRAAVKTAELEESTKVQLWFRVDLKAPEGEYRPGAFDNMDERPIRCEEWKQFDLVLDVADDGEIILIGMFVIGKGKAWLDDVTLEEVDNDTPTTGGSIRGADLSDSAKEQSSGSNLDTQVSSVADIAPNPHLVGESSTDRMQRKAKEQQLLVRDAFQTSENSPQQNFFTHWLWLVVIALVLFALSGLPDSILNENELDESTSSKPILKLVPKFALRFSAVYWLLYSFPGPFSRMAGAVLAGKEGGFYPAFSWIGTAMSEYQHAVDRVVHFAARNVFDLQTRLIPNNGSGDTTWSYIQIFSWFVIAMMVAFLWTSIDWRRTNHSWLKDLLRSYIRYVLALAMLGYGLAKIGFAHNQFPEIGIRQLNQTWGESSPMNLIWSMMGASRPYTIFAGLGEVTAALLLIWRRTTTLGALVAFGVMTNVMMLNFCYDIPVKIYSFHLVVMSSFLLLPEARRLGNVLFFNRETMPIELRPPFTNRYTIWVHRAIKATIIAYLFAIPVWKHIEGERDHFTSLQELPEFFGLYEVESMRIDGTVVDSGATEQWDAVKFEQRPWGMSGMEPSYWMTGNIPNLGPAQATFKLEGDNTLKFGAHQNAAIPKGEATLESKGDKLVLKGNMTWGEVEATLVRKEELYLLTGRGFRWINEVPFNH